MYPELFSIGPITVYSYGVLLAASYLLGLRLAMTRAQDARPRQQPRPRPRHLHHHRGAGRREAAAARRGLRSVPPLARRPVLAGASRRRVLRRPAPGVAVAFWYIAPTSHALLDDMRCVCAGHCAGPRHRASRVHGRRLLLRQANDVPWAIIFTNPLAAANVGTPLEHPAASDAALRGRRGAADSGLPAGDRAAVARIRRAHVLGLHAALRRSRATSSSSIAAIRAAWCSACPRRSSSHSILAPLSHRDAGLAAPIAVRRHRRNARTTKGGGLAVSVESDKSPPSPTATG